MIAAIDFETGGISPERSAIVSAACVLVNDNLREIEIFYTVVNDPGRELLPEAMKVNGVTPDEISQGMPVDQALYRICQIVEGRTVMAFNAKFDVAFLNIRAGLNIQQAIDPMRLAYRRWPHPQKNKLSIVASRFGVSVTDIHNSLGDVRTTVQVLRRFSLDNPAVLQPEQIGWNWKPWEGD